MGETFKRKNEIGVEIEYTIVGYCFLNEKKYMLYSDFYPKKCIEGIRIFVDEVKENEYIKLEEKEAEEIIKQFNKTIINEGRK